METMCSPSGMIAATMPRESRIDLGSNVSRSRIRAEAAIGGEYVDSAHCRVDRTSDDEDEHASDVAPGGVALRPQQRQENEDACAKEEREDEMELPQGDDVDDLPDDGICAVRLTGLTGAVEEVGDVDE